jgi:hypothetical protein
MSNPLTPRDARTSVIIKALVRTSRGESERRVRNLSTAGACLDHSGDLVDGDELSLELGTLTNLPAKVIWTRDRIAGVRFAQAIDVHEAKQSRGVHVAVASGWLAELKDAYR